VLEEVVANLKLADDPDALAGQITVSAVRDTQLIILTVEDTDPQRAADIANETVRVFSRQNQALQTSRYVDTRQSLERELAKVQLDIDRTQAGLADLKTTTSPADVAERDRLQALLAQYRDSYATLLKSMGDVQLAELQSTNTISVAEPARPESGAIRPRTMRNTLIGLIVGMLLAIGIAFLIEYLDDRLKSSVQVTELAATMTLGMIGQIDEAGPNGKLVTVRKKQSPVAEAYRMLRVNLDFAAIDRPLRVIAVTSGGPEEGKSTTIANLAVAIAQTGKQVILVDTDLRRPTLHHIFQVPNDRGVTTALLNPSLEGVRGHLVRPGVNNLLLLPSGPIPPNPAELLGSQRMAELIEDLKGQADVVLFDTPPMLVFADATLLARICDGTLLVARARFTRIGALVQSRQQIDQAGARLLGVVLNRVPTPRGGNQSYYYYYGARPDAQPKRRFLGLRWPFARASKPAENVPPAATSDMQRLQAAMSAVKRNGAALDGAIDRADVSVGVERGPINSHGGNGHGAQPASNGSQVDLAVSRNGNGSYPGSKQRP
jgi:non-specific protein-tyrosine kinase